MQKNKRRGLLRNWTRGWQSVGDDAGNYVRFAKDFQLTAFLSQNCDRPVIFFRWIFCRSWQNYLCSLLFGDYSANIARIANALQVFIYCQSLTLNDMISVSQFVSRQTVSLSHWINKLLPMCLSLSVLALVFVIVDTELSEEAEIKSYLLTHR